MFYNCSSLKLIDLSSFNTTNVKNMSHMFQGCCFLQSIDLSSFNTTNVKNMSYMFETCPLLQSIDLVSFNATNIKNMLDMFSQCSSLQSINLSSFNTTNVEDMNGMVAQNEKGTSLSTKSSLRIGKTAIGFLSVYATPDELIANGDDDEASAWLWLHETYPTAQYVYFGDVHSAADVEPFRVLFWLRDLEGVGEDAVWSIPEVVENATPIIREWYKNGGSLLLWSHATTYVGHLGRLNLDDMKGNDHAIGTGEGGINNDVWKMSVQLNPGSRFSKDHSTHPIYKGLEVESTDRTKLIAFKGPGWTEDHNCLFFNLPSLLTGIGNQEEACYTQLTQTFGIYPLGTWDSQIDWVSQMNVWEAQQGNTDFQGTILCIGNGGCEFSMKNADGTPDKSAHPKNNIYQDNVLTLAKNSLEYLKTR